MKFVRVLIFFLFFSVDITVHAKSLAALKFPVQEPFHCLTKDQVCAFSTYPDTKYEFNVAGTRIILGADTFVTRLERGRFELVRGLIWVMAEDEIVIETEYGQIKIYHGEALIQRNSKHVITQSLLGEVTLYPKGGSPLNVEKGFENTLSPVNSSGIAQTGIPQLMDFRAITQTLSHLYFGSKYEFKKLAKTWMREWPDLVSKASQFHLELTRRSIASDIENQEQELRRRQAMEMERRRLQQLFRTKTLEY